MTDWARLAEPFDPSEIKQRPGRGGMTFSYVDARAVMQRLDDVLTPEGWDFQWSLADKDIVHGKLVIGSNIREDVGYPNSDEDDEPLKSAVSDALKRCAVHYGVGRHLYTDKVDRGARRERTQAALVANGEAPQRPRSLPVDTDILEPDPDDYEALETTAPMRRPEPEVCPWHPNREPKTGKYGLFCSGQGGNGPLNAKGYCDYKFAA